MKLMNGAHGSNDVDPEQPLSNPSQDPPGGAQKKKGESTTVEKLIEHFRLWWRPIFVISCVLAVSVDPLFFYLPIVDEKNKCLGIDSTLKIVALTLRSLTDVTLLVNIAYKIREYFMLKRRSRRTKLEQQSIDPNNSEGSGRENAAFGILSNNKNTTWNPDNKIIQLAKAVLAPKWFWSILIDILALLPIPQILIVAAFSEMRSSNYLDRRKVLNFFLLAQYVPRVYRMHESSIELRIRTGIWIKATFNFYLYILASHVLGAFWYFFSIVRETSCWHRTCLKHSPTGCNFYCNDDITLRNMTFINSLDQFCLVDIPDNVTAPFEFGIFLDSLKTGNSGSIKFIKKFSYSFWWGLRNLSNFGTNLETSTYVWENCFAVLISIIGLLLFLYLIGNVQTFIQMQTQNLVEKDKTLKGKKLDIQIWMAEQKLDKYMKLQIKKYVTKEWEHVKGVDMQTLFSVVPPETKRTLKVIVGMNTIRNVPRLKQLDQSWLKLMCEYLIPVSYPDHSFIFRMEEPIDRMIFVTKGFILTSTISERTQDGKVKTIEKSLGMEDSYGVEELFKWVSSIKAPSQSSHPAPNGVIKSYPLPPSDLPVSNANVKCHSKVDCFVLLAKDLILLASRRKVLRNWEFSDMNPQQIKDMAELAIKTRLRDLNSRRRDHQIKQRLGTSSYCTLSCF